MRLRGVMGGGVRRGARLRVCGDNQSQVEFAGGAVVHAPTLDYG